MNDTSQIKLWMVPQAASGWNFLLQKGFYLTGHEGMTVREFMREILGYDDGFIDGTVRTVFLNCSPVDDIDTAFIKNGDKLSLGSAMPGLVGICMGRDNPYKSFRSGISVDKKDVANTATPARVFMKIFSTLAVDTGVDILGRGIEIDAGLLSGFLDSRKEQVKKVEGSDIASLLETLRTTGTEVPVAVFFE